MHKQDNNKPKIVVDILYAYKIFCFAGVPNDIRFFVDNIANKLKNKYDIKLNYCSNPNKQIFMYILDLVPNVNKILSIYKKLTSVFIIKHLIHSIIKYVNKIKRLSEKLSLKNLKYNYNLRTDFYINETSIELDFDIIDNNIIISFVLDKYIYLNKIEIVRIHDIIWLTHPKTVNENSNIKEFREALVIKTNLTNICFLCNSLPTINKLIEMFPSAKNKCYIVPYIIPEKQRIQDSKKLYEIIINKLSVVSINTWFKSKLKTNIQNIFRQEIPFKYILMVSTIEPRKNHINAIKAWIQLRKNNPNINIKLVICGKPGWKYNEIFKAISKYVKKGEIIHLMGVKNDELNILFSHAECFLFPSIAEGFGIPPVEASQCGCPVIVSDIEEHRWVMEDAALYCQHDNVNSIEEQLYKILIDENKDNLRNELILKMPKIANKFNVENITKSWIDAIDDIISKTNI